MRILIIIDCGIYQISAAFKIVRDAGNELNRKDLEKIF